MKNSYNSKQLEPIQRETLSESITERLINYILENGIKPGEKLPSERTLSKTLDVSRLPLRESVSRLRGLGILESRQGSGSKLSEFTIQPLFQTISPFFCTQHNLSINEMIEARKAIEIPIVRFAAKRAKSKDIKKLKICIRQMEKSCKQNREMFIKADMAFHHALAMAGQNKVLCTFMELMHSIVLEVQHLFPDNPEKRRRSLQFHNQIFEFVCSHNVQAAQKIMQDHLDDIERSVKNNDSSR